MIRRLFHILSVRERVLLTIFVWIGLAFWASEMLKEWRGVDATFDATAMQLQAQDEWFRNEPTIATELTAALQRVDPNKTFSGNQLVGRLDRIADSTLEASTRFDITAPQTETGEIFDVHSVRVQIRGAGLSELIAFDEQLKQESPYLGLERVQFLANRNDPRFLDTQFHVSSFELKDLEF